MDSELSQLFITHSAKKLEQMTGQIEACLSKLGDDLVWNRGGGHENTVANLVLHLQGNVRQWIIHGAGGAPDVRQRDLEFSTAGGRSASDLAADLRQTVNEAIAVLSNLTADRLCERVVPQHDEVSVLEAIYQCVGHFQLHAGQIVYATKQLIGESLGFYRPPPAAANPRL